MTWPTKVHRVLRVRAAHHGHSAQAEVRAIPTSTVKPASRVHMGDALAALGREIGLTNEDFDVLTQVTDKTAAEPLGLE